jgi:hypothetical protein
MRSTDRARSSWTPVPNDKINNVVAPDGGTHVCADEVIE